MKFGDFGKKVRNLREDDDPTLATCDLLRYPTQTRSLFLPYKIASKRNTLNTIEFISDLKSRINNRIQISSDAMNAYAGAVEFVFRQEVDYVQIVKPTAQMKVSTARRNESIARRAFSKVKRSGFREGPKRDMFQPATLNG